MLERTKERKKDLDCWVEFFKITDQLVKKRILNMNDF